MSTARKFVHESELLKNIHGPFFPSDVREGENISATVEIEDTKEIFEYRVWKLSPLGVELLDQENGGMKQGQKVNISIFINGQVTRFSGLVVDAVNKIENRKTIGVRLTLENNETYDNVNRRGQKRWVTSSQFLPTGMTPNPAKYNDFIFFRVKDISGNGMQITTSLRNKFILKGMVFDTSISFPMVSQVRAKLKVENIRITNEGQSEYLALGVTFLEKSTELIDAIGQYLSQFSIIDSLDDLHKAGFSPSTLKSAIKFSYVKTEEDYNQVLELRLLANKKEGKIDLSSKREDMADIYDTRSRIVIGKIGDKVVASGRMTFNEFDQKLEHENYISWPQDYPRREQSVEIMRLCTHPEYRGSDILILMFKFMAAASVQSKRQWIILSSTEKYIPLYEKIGGKRTKQKFNFPTFGNQEHEIVIGNVKDSLMGKSLNPIYWNYVYGDLIDYLEEYSLMEVSPGDRIRLMFYKALAPVTRMLISFVVNPRKIERARLRALESDQ